MYTDYAFGFNRGAKKPWTPDEDSILINLVNKIGTKNWSEVAASLPGRVGKQCRERWYNHLDPGIKKGDWTAEEDEIILTYQRLYGNQWSKITKLLPGRTDNAVKNRWHATARARSHSISSQMDVDGEVRVGRRRSRGSSIGDGDTDDYSSADGRASSWAQRLSDSDLLLDASHVADVSMANESAESSILGQNHRAPSDSCPQTSSESSMCDEDDDVSEWAESLRGSASGVDAFISASGTGFAFDEDQLPSLLPSDLVLSFEPESATEAVGFGPTCDSVPHNIPVFCPAPKKPSSIITKIDAALDNHPVKRRHVCSPDMLETLGPAASSNTNAGVGTAVRSSSAGLSEPTRFASEDDMDTLVHVMEMCMSPALDCDRIAICSPDSMTMRGIEFDYLENMT